MAQKNFNISQHGKSHIPKYQLCYIVARRKGGGWAKGKITYEKNNAEKTRIVAESSLARQYQLPATIQIHQLYKKRRKKILKSCANFLDFPFQKLAQVFNKKRRKKS